MAQATETVTLAFLGAKALEELIKFLYGQADELIKRWREKKDTNDVHGTSEPIPFALPPPAFVHPLDIPVVEYTQLDARIEGINKLRDALQDYAHGCRPVEPTDAVMLQDLGTLQREIEAIIGQQITFRSEASYQTPNQLTSVIQVDTAGPRSRIVGAELSHLEPGETVIASVTVKEALGTVIGLKM